MRDDRNSCEASRSDPNAIAPTMINQSKMSPAARKKASAAPHSKSDSSTTSINGSADALQAFEETLSDESDVRTTPVWLHLPEEASFSFAFSFVARTAVWLHVLEEASLSFVGRALWLVLKASFSFGGVLFFNGADVLVEAVAAAAAAATVAGVAAAAAAASVVVVVVAAVVLVVLAPAGEAAERASILVRWPSRSSWEANVLLLFLLLLLLLLLSLLFPLLLFLLSLLLQL